MDILKRIKQLQTERGWTNYKLCAEANLPNVTLTNMYSRQTLPSMATLMALCEAFGISLSQFFNEDENSVILSDEEKKLISGYRKLNKKCKNAVNNFINELAE